MPASATPTVKARVTEKVRQLAATLFGTDQLIARRRYLVTGVLLMALKYAVDLGLVLATTGEAFTPLQYLSPIATVRLGDLPLPPWVVFLMVLWALPFLWIGLSMSLRRALDAGYRPGIALLFLVPFANLGLMAWLCLAPSRPNSVHTDPWSPELSATRMKILAMMVGVSISLVLTALSTQVLGAYGSGLFVGVPVLIGFTTGWLANRSERQTLRSTVGLSSSVIVLSSLAVLLFALEGVVCLALAAPLAMALAALGAALGRAWAMRISAPGVVSLLLLLPLLMGAEGELQTPAPIRAVSSTVVVDAPAAVVWSRVIDFPALPPPTELVFAAGIAYPIRAEIRGAGVGAVRHCVFSTGPFVEPITVWNPPRRLAFDVTSQPPGMRETSPYNHVYAPHLAGYPRSVRGEFLLQPMTEGRTRLVGTTWYRLDLFPQLYWVAFSDSLIHTIHHRVLTHIRALAEAEPT